ncbi:MAG: hypothetical protein KQH53_04635 [Desulfarculaceae bacterium]|nr:hypothetical protein [Desulfarculaceae bacterium]
MHPQSKTSRRWLPLTIIALALVSLVGCGITNTVTDYWHDLMDSQDTNLRKRVVVAPFLSRLPGMEDRAKAVGKAISQRLEKQGGVVLVEFSELRSSLAKVNPKISNSEDRIVDAARGLGLNTVLSGAIVNLSVQYDKTGIYGFRENEPFGLMELDLKLIDVATGVLLGETSIASRVKLTETGASNIRLGKPFPAKVVNILQAELVEPALDWVSDKVSAQAWVGFILAVDKRRVKVTVGRDTGLAMGAELVVYSQGQRIKSGSGRMIYLPGPPVGRLKLVEFESRTAWAVPVIPKQEKKEGEKDAPQSKFSFQPGQVLRTR